MPKATERNTTDRRAFLSEMAAGVAAGAAAVALAAVPALAVPVDPVFAAIDKFKEARSTLREAEAAHASAESEIQSGDRPDLFPGIFLRPTGRWAPSRVTSSAASTSCRAAGPGHPHSGRG